MSELNQGEMAGTSFIMLSKKVGPPFYSALDWHGLQGPVSVTVAVFFGTALALIDASFFDFSPFEIEAPSVIASILLIMDKGTSESFYLAVFYRTLATVAGSSVGMLLCLIEEQIAITYKDVSKRALIHDEDWKIIVFRVCLLAPLILTCAMLVKRYRSIGYPLVVFTVKMSAGLFAKSIRASISSTISGVVAVGVAVLSVVVFDNISTEAAVQKSHKKAMDGVLSVIELALEANPEFTNEFELCTDQVHKSITALEATVAVNERWCQVTCRAPPPNQAILIQPLRPLFYEAFSLYWSNVQSYKADAASGASILFCNNSDAFGNYYRPLLTNLLLAVNGIKLELKEFFHKSYHARQDTQAMLERIIEDHLWNGLFLAQQHMRATYSEYKDECFASFSQRCNITDFLRHVSMITLALVEYLRAIAVIHLREGSPFMIQVSGHLNQLSEALDGMRKSEHVTELRQRISSQDDVFVYQVQAPVNRSIIRAATKGGL